MKVNKKLSKPIKIAIYAVIAIFVLAAIYFAIDRAGIIKTYRLGLQAQEQQQLQNEDQMALESLKKIILLPDDFDPTIAIINDAEALKAEQPDFFGNAKNGDRIIIYPDTAIIYDYQANKIIKVGPVQIGQPPEAENMETPQ
jgi:hypothetical protein